MINATPTETSSPRERVHDPVSGREEPRPSRRSARMSSVRSSTAYNGPATAVPTAGTVPADLASWLPEPGAGARRTSLNGATLPTSSYGPIDIPATGSCDASRAGEGGQALQGGAPATEHRESSLVVGDGPVTTAGSSSSSSWVRFAWEPLIAEGGSRDLSVSAAGSGVGVGSAPATNGVTLLQELSGDPAVSSRHGNEKGVKRARASTVGGVGKEAAAGWVESCRSRQAVPGRTEWDWGEGRPRRQPCWRHEPSVGEFGAGGVAPQTGSARAEPGPVDSFSMSSRELAGAPEVAGRPEGGYGHAPQPAVGCRGYSGRSVGGVSTRSSGKHRDWGGGGLGNTKEGEQAGGIGATAATAAVPAYQQHREQDDSQEGGARAKKPRYHRSRAQRTLSVTQMDTLTDGVSSLGVASSEATNSDSDSDDGKGAPPALSGRPGHLSPRETLNGSKNGAIRPEPLRPTLALDGVGRSGTGGGGRGGRVGARCNTTATRSQTARSGAAAGSPGWQHQPKRRRNGSLSTGCWSFRYRKSTVRFLVHRLPSSQDDAEQVAS